MSIDRWSNNNNWVIPIRTVWCTYTPAHTQTVDRPQRDQKQFQTHSQNEAKIAIIKITLITIRIRSEKDLWENFCSETLLFVWLCRFIVGAVVVVIITIHITLPCFENRNSHNWPNWFPSVCDWILVTIIIISCGRSRHTRRLSPA